MKNTSAIASIYLEKRKIVSGGLHPVKLRITFQGKRKYYGLKKIPFLNKIKTSEIKKIPFHLSLIDFEKINSSKARGIFREYKKYFQVIENRVNEVCAEINEFSFEEFETSFFNFLKKTSKVEDFFQIKINELNNNKQIGTAKGYAATLNSLLQFYKKKPFHVQHINVKFLMAYEEFMLGNGKSYTTIGIYLRNVKYIINEAIRQGILTQKQYPFGIKSDHSKYTIPKSNNIKKALTKEEIKKIFEYTPESPQEQMAKDYWTLSYMCNGMNMADIAHLKFENIKDNKIQFYRKKTINTSENKKIISIIINDRIKEIITRVGNENNSEVFVFPIVNTEMTAEQQHAKVSQHIKNINKYIKAIAGKIDIDKNFTTYWARHSFSTVLKRSGAPISFISEQLGHHSLKTTDNYLDSFQDEVKEKYANVLTDF